MSEVEEACGEAVTPWRPRSTRGYWRRHRFKWRIARLFHAVRHPYFFVCAVVYAVRLRLWSRRVRLPRHEVPMDLKCYLHSRLWRAWPSTYDKAYWGRFWDCGKLGRLLAGEDLSAFPPGADDA